MDDLCVFVVVHSKENGSGGGDTQHCEVSS